MRVSPTEVVAALLAATVVFAAQTGVTAETRTRQTSICRTASVTTAPGDWCEVAPGGSREVGAQCACKAPDGSPMLGRVELQPADSAPPGNKAPHHEKTDWN